MTSFSFLEAENLKKECARALRKAGHKSMRHNAKRKRKRFAKADDTKIKQIDSKGNTYWDYVERVNNGKETLAANPDLYEDDLNNTVDGS